MFDFGFWEFVIIAVVALIVVGPERLPGLARQIGTWVGKTRRFVNSVRSDIERELQAEELKEILNKQQGEIQELKGMLSRTETEVQSGFEETDHLVKAIEEQLDETHSAQTEHKRHGKKKGAKRKEGGSAQSDVS